MPGAGIRAIRVVFARRPRMAREWRERPSPHPTRAWISLRMSLGKARSHAASSVDRSSRGECQVADAARIGIPCRVLEHCELNCRRQLDEMLRYTERAEHRRPIRQCCLHIARISTDAAAKRRSHCPPPAFAPRARFRPLHLLQQSNSAGADRRIGAARAPHEMRGQRRNVVHARRASAP